MLIKLKFESKKNPEIHRNIFEKSNVDKEKGVIKNIAILGQKSENGRFYKDTAMREAVPRYEGVKVFDNHDYGFFSSGRSIVNEMLGKIVNPRFEESTKKIMGDFLVREKYRNDMFDLAENFSESVGFSHTAYTEGDEQEDDIWTIHKIVDVESVDLVDRPATNKNMFESKHDINNNNEGDEMDISKVLENQEALNKAIEGSSVVVSLKTELEKVKIENKALKAKNEELTESVEKTTRMGKWLEKYNVPNDLLTDGAKSILEALLHNEEKFKETVEYLCKDAIKTETVHGKKRTTDSSMTVESAVSAFENKVFG